MYANVRRRNSYVIKSVQCVSLTANNTNQLALLSVALFAWTQYRRPCSSRFCRDIIGFLFHLKRIYRSNTHTACNHISFTHRLCTVSNAFTLPSVNKHARFDRESKFFTYFHQLRTLIRDKSYNLNDTYVFCLFIPPRTNPKIENQLHLFAIIAGYLLKCFDAAEHAQSMPNYHDTTTQRIREERNVFDKFNHATG